ncbi:SMI1/KNR4 family protein [Streptomyces sp. NPDC005395]|uniref:SMI1/KNR4 family protein n=1 Tax=Streptomyces sp. NPDC005395 TaxID=3157042 RepID=UPI0033AC5683
MMSLQEIGALMPRSSESDVQIPWATIESSWDFTFPSDYRSFIDSYGAGAIEDYLEILEPRSWDAEAVGDGMPAETRNARLGWTVEPKRDFPVSSEPMLVAWGVDASADLLCWDTARPNPEDWPVIVWSRGDAVWRKYECGMLEFLGQVLRADLPSNPLGDEALWNTTPAKFVSKVEEARLLNEGIDPWE